MEGHKPWYESAGIWGGTASIVSGVLAIFDISVDAAAIAGVIGGAVAVFGRIRATRRIGCPAEVP